MNFMQVISSLMMTWQAVVFWILIFAFSVCAVLVCLAFKADRDIKLEEKEKVINSLTKENAELAGHYKATQDLYRKAQNELVSIQQK